MRIEPRVRQLARQMARNDAAIVQPGPGPLGAPDSRFDGIARVLAAPLTRRRALAAAGGAVAAASLLRPARASADCWPGGPQVCANSHGAKVCVPADLACCSNDNCAIACPYPWRICESPAVCADTAAMCRNPAAGFAKDQTKFCSQRIGVTNGCVDSGSSMAIRGWCCKPTESCGSDFGQCDCTSPCGDACCNTDEECVSLGFFNGKACLKKCPPGWHHDGPDCVCDSGQTCGLRCCKAGQVCQNNRCVAPPDPTKLRNPFDAFGNFGDTINQAAGVGGSYARDRAAAAAGTPVSAALLALAAVNVQGVAAGLALTDTNFDNAYRRRVGTPRPVLPRLASGAGLDARAASALQALLTAEANGFALLLASGTALARARGALKHHNNAAARKQVSAAAGFAEKAARSLKRTPSLRATAATALRAAATAEVVVSSGHVSMLQAQIRVTGVPADLRGVLRGLGVQGTDLSRAKTALLIDSPGGSVLIAPLADSARTRNLQTIAAELAQFARSARRQPITHTRPGPKRFKQKVR